MRLTLDSNPLIYDVNFGNLGYPDRSLGVSFVHNFDSNLNIKAGTLYADGFMWYIRGDEFMSFDSSMGLMHNWISFTYTPEQLFSLKFSLAHTSVYHNTTLVSGITDEGIVIQNPYLINEGLNYIIRFDYAL